MQTLISGATIHTMDPARPVVEALLCEGGIITALGDAKTLQAQAPTARRLDLNGAFAYPGLIDSHLHILNKAVTDRELVLGDVTRREDFFSLLRAWCQARPAGTVIDGRGFNEDLWADKRLPTRRELDAVAPDHALRLTRVCGHLAVANSLAMKMAGVTPQTNAPEGGWMDYEKGFFAEDALALLFTDEADGGVDKCRELLMEGMNHAADRGLTAIYSDDFGTFGYSMSTVVKAYRQLEAAGRMPVRVVQQCALPTDEALTAFLDAGLRYGQGKTHYFIGPRKLYADGSLGARTALLSVPYADAPDKRGVAIYSQEALNRLAEQSHRAGLPFIVHAIGDRAVESVLTAVQHARAALPAMAHLRDGIVHCQITSRHTLERIIALGVDVYAQPVFLEYDLNICLSRVGAALTATSYNWKTLLDGGVCVSAGSDCPVEPLDPVKNIHCAVNRQDFDGHPAGGWLPGQRLTMEEALRLHTVLAARTANMENRIGALKEGLFADLTVFARDFFGLPSAEIRHQKPLMTIVGGLVRPCPQTP